MLESARVQPLPEWLKISHLGRGVRLQQFQHRIDAPTDGRGVARVGLFVKMILEAGQRHGATMAFTQLDGVESPWQVAPEEFSQTGEFRWKKLTKEFFFGLPDETAVVSTVMGSAGKPLFQAYLGGKARTDLWRHATQALAAQKNCIAIRGPDCGIDYDLVI